MKNFYKALAINETIWYNIFDSICFIAFFWCLRGNILTIMLVNPPHHISEVLHDKEVFEESRSVGGSADQK